MKIINATYQIVKPDLDDPKTYSDILKDITQVGHTAYKSAAQVTDEKAEGLANAIKYLTRCKLKGTPEQDIRKAIWYATHAAEGLRKGMYKINE